MRGGWTADKIVELLAKKDFKISAGLLHDYLRDPKTKAAGVVKGRRSTTNVSGRPSKSTVTT